MANKKKTKTTIEIHGSVDTFMEMLCCALRYSLGRMTFVTSTTPDYIKSNIELITENWFIIYLRDLCDYEERRYKWSHDGKPTDMLCDYTSWIELKKFLVDEFIKREFEQPLLSNQGIFLTEMPVFYVKDNVRELVGYAATINEGLNIIFDHIEKHGEAPPHYRNSESYGVVYYDIGSATEWYEIETADFSMKNEYTADKLREKQREHGNPFADCYNEDGTRRYP